MLIYLLPLAAYLFGSISTAVLIARAMGLQDPREVGSRNPGATNILRYGGKTAAVLTLLGDILKGVIPVLIARALTADAVIITLCGFAAFLGHLFPVFFSFRGGKGVATALGVWFALNPWVGLALLATWILMALLFRYSSLAALTASAARAAVCRVAVAGHSLSGDHDRHERDFDIPAPLQHPQSHRRHGNQDRALVSF